MLIVLLIIVAITNIVAASPDPRIPAYFDTPLLPHNFSTLKDDKEIEAAFNQWSLVIDLYNKHLRLTHIYADQPRIPLIIHQIWLGSPVPDKYKTLQESFKQHHPNWQYKLWTDADIAALGLTNQKTYDAATNWGQKSDIARYEILYRFGGVYVDMDAECLAPFDALHHCCDFYAGVSPLHKEVVAENCIVGAAPGNLVLKYCIDTLGLRERARGYFHGIIEETGPKHLTASFFAVVTSKNPPASINILVPQHYFFTYDLFTDKVIRQKPLLAIHYWEGAWQEPDHRWHKDHWEHYEERWLTRDKR